MNRYIIFSFCVHLLLAFVMVLRNSNPFENPQIEISLFESEISAKADARPGSKPKEKAASGADSKRPSEAQQALARKLIADPVPDSQFLESESASDSESRVALSVDQVTKLPKVLVQERAEYPESAKQARVEGAVKLTVTIDTLGRVQRVEVLEGPGFGLNETAQAALMKFQFSPAEKEGSKVPVKITYVYRFRLESR